MRVDLGVRGDAAAEHGGDAEVETGHAGAQRPDRRAVGPDEPQRIHSVGVALRHGVSPARRAAGPNRCPAAGSGVGWRRAGL
ncbi:hypothetical protein [Amycolatopsis sp. NPDC049868]|uniref:hypothetical protein n=1 Tax=Amycolatopsis sp. NPDC049868 TaxID=3363934 RepID=UPI0037983F6B